MLEKIISGGQTGADQAGLLVAKTFKIPTGGWLPAGCRTLDGPRPDLLKLYDMQEHESGGYSERTDSNVRDSDGTIRLAYDFKSAGEKCTLKAIKWYNRPYIDVNLKKPLPIQEVIDWIKKEKIRVLNVAGNSEKTSPGISKEVFEYLSQVLGTLSED